MLLSRKACQLKQIVHNCRRSSRTQLQLQLDSRDYYLRRFIFETEAKYKQGKTIPVADALSCVYL